MSTSAKDFLVERDLLITCLREIFPHLKKFSEASFEYKLGGRAKFDQAAQEFLAYIERDRVMMKNERIHEGIQLLEMLRDEMKAAYNPMPVSPKTIGDCLVSGWMDSILERQSDWLDLRFL